MKVLPTLAASLVTLVLASTSAALGSQAAPTRATADIEGRSGSALSGTADFSMMGNELMVTLHVQEAPPGVHGVHIHQNADCSAADASSAGDHFNPTGKAHGGPSSPEHHAGDLGNLTVGPDGKGTLTLHTKDMSLATPPNGVIGHSIIIHERQDDFTTQPSGNSGSRIGCGVIAAAPGK
jgi:superoxide dismutase, Cu-Zn family